MCDRVDYFKEKIEILAGYENDFIAGQTLNKISSFLKKQGTEVAMMLYYALMAEFYNVKAKKYVLSDHQQKSRSSYRKKHEYLCSLINEIHSWNTNNPDELILYGGALDDVTGQPVVYFNLPNTEQISFHDQTKRDVPLPKYSLPWDNQLASTLVKIRQGIINNFHDEMDFRYGSCPETTVIEFNPSEEDLANVKETSTEKERVWEQLNYMKKNLCGVGSFETIHAIKKGWKEEVENQAPMFLVYMIHAEEERLDNRTNLIRTPSTDAVKKITGNFRKCAEKKRFLEYEIRFKKVKSVYGKYLVTFEATMKNNAHIKFSLYSKETLVKQNTPGWIKKDKSRKTETVDNIAQIEQFAKKFIFE